MRTSVRTEPCVHCISLIHLKGFGAAVPLLLQIHSFLSLETSADNPSKAQTTDGVQTDLLKVSPPSLSDEEVVQQKAQACADLLQ